MLVAVVRTWFDQGVRACKKSCWPEWDFSCLEWGIHWENSGSVIQWYLQYSSRILWNMAKIETLDTRHALDGNTMGIPEYHCICHLCTLLSSVLSPEKGGNMMTEWNIVTWSRSPQKVVMVVSYLGILPKWPNISGFCRFVKSIEILSMSSPSPRCLLTQGQ